MAKHRPMIGWVLLAIGVAAVFAYLAWALSASWAVAGAVSLGMHGWIAVGIAFVVTGLLGGGLMWLAFYSSRKGYDEAVGTDDDPL